MVRLNTKNQLYSLPGSASKVCVGGWWWWCWVVESELSDWLQLKPNNIDNPLDINTEWKLKPIDSNPNTMEEETKYIYENPNTRIQDTWFLTHPPPYK